MFFNKILSLPITDTTRCRIYKSPTSFMAKTYFNEDCTPKNSIIVDNVSCYIRTGWRKDINLFYNEEKELFTLSFIYRDLYNAEKLYYIIFKIDDLKEVLANVLAKSTLYNNIHTINECEYTECKTEDGFFILDSYNSILQNNTSEKLLNMIINTSAMEVFFTNEDGLIDTKQIIKEELRYFVKIDNFIIHKSLLKYIDVLIFAGYNDKPQFYGSEQTLNIKDIIKQYNEKPFEYALNSDGSAICCLYSEADKICCFASSLYKEYVENISQLNVFSTSAYVELKKEQYTNKAWNKVINKTIDIYNDWKSMYNCSYTLQKLINKMRTDDIFMLFNM